MSKHYYTPKSGKTLARQNRMTKKLSPTQAHVIVKDYMKIQSWKHSTFQSVKELCKARWITRNVPNKLYNRFSELRKLFYPDKEIDYNKNIFLQRSQLCKHRKLPEEKQYEEFVKQFPRWGYQSYCARCEQKDKEKILKEWMFYYYKDWMKQKTKSKAPNKNSNYKRMDAKEWYDELYKIYDFVIHIDGKSMEDQERIRSNSFLINKTNRLTMWVEAKSWILLWIWIEKHHDKSNASMIIKEITENIEMIFGEDRKICFVTDAGSEYLNNKDLRWIEVTSLDTSSIAKYLRWKWHSRRITRRPEDNGFIENKNDYIERSCLDSYEIEECDEYGFACLLDSFLERNNSYLKWCKKCYRWKDVTPYENIKSRFWEIQASERIRSLNVKYIEAMYKIDKVYKKQSIPKILKLLRFNIKPMVRHSKNSFYYDEKLMHPKSLDSTNIFSTQKW